MKTVDPSLTRLTGSGDPVAAIMVGIEGIVELWSSRPKPAAEVGAERSPSPRLLEVFSIAGLSPPPPFKYEGHGDRN